jgi:hypothetical protein
MMRDQTLRGVVGCVAHEIKGDSVMKFLQQILCTSNVVGDFSFVGMYTIANPMKPHINCLAALLLA